MRILLIFLTTAIFLGCRDAVGARRGEPRTSPRWILWTFASIVAIGYFHGRLIE